jgi:hypothetical protein
MFFSKSTKGRWHSMHVPPCCSAPPCPTPLTHPTHVGRAGRVGCTGLVVHACTWGDVCGAVPTGPHARGHVQGWGWGAHGPCGVGCVHMRGCGCGSARGGSHEGWEQGEGLVTRGCVPPHVCVHASPSSPVRRCPSPPLPLACAPSPPPICVCAPLLFTCGVCMCVCVWGGGGAHTHEGGCAHGGAERM